jgi:NAD(P)H-dependent flavin oxidoreductase YrpB (nitropropane dioxygenase family)
MKERTDRPFGVNMRGDQVDIDERVDLMIREGIRVASFAGPPRRSVIDKLKENDIVTMPTIGMKRHAEKMQEWGVDAVIAQGHEGGGHTGPVPTSLLLPEVAKAVDIPVLGAGGFKSGIGLVAALSWGAAGIAMGTRFLLTQESQVPAHIKEQYLLANERSTVVTTKIDGAPQRVIETSLVKRLERSNPVARFFAALRNAWVFRKITDMSFIDTIKEALSMKKTRDLSFAELAMAANAPMLTRASMVDGNLEAGILPTGQVTGIIGELPTVAELIAEIVEEAEERLDLLAERHPARR